jgi:acyl-CoA dehydrogenase
MHFGLTDEQAVLQETARRFAVEEVAPIAAQYDQSGEFPRALIQKAWELGLSSTAIPPEYGGVGLPSVDTCILTEEVAWGCSGIGTSIMCNDLGLMPIILAGSQEQKRKWLTPCTDEFTLISFCLSEPEAGSDVAGLQLQAEKDGDAYRLSGTKCWITNGGEANLYTVFATLDRSSRHKGICAFVVPADTPGISLGKKEDKMGQRASDTRVIHFDGVRVPASQRLGAEGEGFKIAMRTLDRTRPPIAALATGIARRALEESVQYARERKAFGQPIGGFQAVQFMLADMAKEIEASGASRRSSSCWRTWPRRSKRRACSRCRAPG